MLKDNPVFFFKVRVIFIYCLKTYKYWRSQKNTYHLLTHLYDQIHFDRRVQFHPSIRSSYTWSDNSDQKS